MEKIPAGLRAAQINSRRSNRVSKPRTTFLVREEIEAIHDASLQVLEKTGIKVLSKKALDILKEAGVKADYEKKRATIPVNLVEEALKRASEAIK